MTKLVGAPLHEHYKFGVLEGARTVEWLLWMARVLLKSCGLYGTKPWSIKASSHLSGASSRQEPMVEWPHSELTLKGSLFMMPWYNCKPTPYITSVSTSIPPPHEAATLGIPCHEMHRTFLHLQRFFHSRRWYEPWLEFKMSDRKLLYCSRSFFQLLRDVSFYTFR